MNARSVDAGQGWAWIQCAWQLFLKNAGIWIVMFICYVGIAIALGFIPFLGQLAFALLSPVLTAGFMYTAHQANQDIELDIKDLFQGFKDKPKLNALLTLGAISLVCTLVIGAITFVFIGGAVMATMMNGGGSGVSDVAIAGMSIGVVLWILVVVTLQLLLFMGLIFAIPLVMFNDIEPVAAVKSSFHACMKNMWPMTVYSLVLLFLSVIAIIPFGLGFVILIPVIFISIYCMYKSVYE